MDLLAPTSTTLVLDTSVLVNFLAVDRLDLLAHYPALCVVTDHVRAEVLDFYHERYQRFQKALADQIILEVRVDRLDELQTFAELSQVKRLGLGECSAIAAAVHRHYHLALDDRRARNEAKRRFPSLTLQGTADIIVTSIEAGLLTLAEADAIKEVWAAEHSFRLKIVSFSDLL